MSWWDHGWHFRRKITFANSTRGALTDFPVALALDSSRIDYDRCKTDLGDVRFVDADDATELEFERVRVDTAGTSIFVVKVPDVAATDADYIWCYYGNPGAATAAHEPGTANGAAVWDSGFLAVYHFEEQSGDYINSKSSVGLHDLTPAGSVTRSTASVSFGYAPTFGGTTSDYCDAPNHADWNSFTDQTVEALSNRASGGSTASSGSGGVSIYPIAAGGRGEAENNAADVWLFFGDTGSNVGTDFEDNTTSGNDPLSGATSLSTGTWYHLAAAFRDSTNAHDVYVDGANDGNQTNTNSINTGGTHKLGVGTTFTTSGSAGGAFKGQIGELRISNVARSADWISATNAQLRDTMNSYGAEEQGQNLVRVT